MINTFSSSIIFFHKRFVHYISERTWILSKLIWVPKTLIICLNIRQIQRLLVVEVLYRWFYSESLLLLELYLWFYITFCSTNQAKRFHLQQSRFRIKDNVLIKKNLWYTFRNELWFNVISSMFQIFLFDNRWIEPNENIIWKNYSKI